VLIAYPPAHFCREIGARRQMGRASAPASFGLPLTNHGLKATIRSLIGKFLFRIATAGGIIRVSAGKADCGNTEQPEACSVRRFVQSGRVTGVFPGPAERFAPHLLTPGRAGRAKLSKSRRKNQTLSGAPAH